MSKTDFASKDLKDRMGGVESRFEDLLIVRDFNIVTSGTKNKGNEFVKPPTVSGYKPIGVIGYHELSDTKCVYSNMYYSIDYNTVEIAWRTIDNTNITNHKCNVLVLYIKQ